eukprot:scaffold41612_cov75-Phaeocystis_antarctica.AAC.3
MLPESKQRSCSVQCSYAFFPDTRQKLNPRVWTEHSASPHSSRVPRRSSRVDLTVDEWKVLLA